MPVHVLCLPILWRMRCPCVKHFAISRHFVTQVVSACEPGVGVGFDGGSGTRARVGVDGGSGTRARVGVESGVGAGIGVDGGSGVRVGVDGGSVAARHSASVAHVR